jgi:hypothetical protein
MGNGKVFVMVFNTDTSPEQLGEVMRIALQRIQQQHVAAALNTSGLVEAVFAHYDTVSDAPIPPPPPVDAPIPPPPPDNTDHTDHAGTGASADTAAGTGASADTAARACTGASADPSTEAPVPRPPALPPPAHVLLKHGQQQQASPSPPPPRNRSRSVMRPPAEVLRAAHSRLVKVRKARSRSAV